MALLEFGANPMASLAVCLLSSDREFSLREVFGGHSVIFLWTLVGTVMPLEESSGVLLLFRQALGGGLMPPGSLGCGGCAQVHVREFAQGGCLLG